MNNKIVKPFLIFGAAGALVFVSLIGRAQPLVSGSFRVGRRVQRRHSKHTELKYFLNNLSNSGLAVRRYGQAGATSPTADHFLASVEVREFLAMPLNRNLKRRTR